MRIAAGVMLIIASLGNLFGGLAYAGLGGLMGAGGNMVEAGVTVNDNGVQQTFRDEDAGRDMKRAGGLVVLWGGGLLILGGLNIAAAVMLFLAKNSVFIMVVAGIEVIADAATMVTFSTYLWSTIGLVAGVLAFTSGKSLHAEGA